MKIFNKINSKSPFFYIIREIDTKRLYAGYCKAEKHCNSDTFMTDSGYTTTSKVVKSLIETNGIHSFVVERIRHFDTWESAIEYEHKFLTKVDAMRNIRFLNKSNGAKTFRCLSLDENARAKLRSKRHTEETKQKMRDSALLRNPPSLETRLKISIKAKNRIVSDETKAKISLASKSRKPITEETRKRMSLSSRGRKLSEDFKEKLRMANLGKKASDEAKLKMSLSHKKSKWWNDGEKTKFCENSPGIQWSLGRIYSRRNNTIKNEQFS